MALTEIGICNMALSRLDLNPINSFIEATKEARTCKIHYEQTRDFVLRGHKWGFATKEDTLALLDATYTGWDYAYQFPSDCLAPRYIYNPTLSAYEQADEDYTLSTSGTKIPFEVRASSSGDSKIILTDQEDAILIYTAKVTQPTAFDSQFIEALVLKLASVLAYPLRRDKGMGDGLLNEYRLFVGEAKATDANEEVRNDTDPGDFVKARS